LNKMGRKRVPVYRLDVDSSSPRALKVLAGDNEIENLALQDDRALTELLKEINDADGLLGTGFDEMMLAALVMVTRPAGEIADFDAAAHWVGMPEYDAGQQVLNVNIKFMSEEDRSDFLTKLGLNAKDVGRRYSKGRTWSMWWPIREELNDMASVRFEEAE